MAHRQGPESVKFVKDARLDDKKLQNMISSYMVACPESCEGGNKRRGTWCVARYVERVRAASGVVRDRVGEMMWEKLWIEHAMSTRGGRMTEEDAVAQWKRWESGVLRGDKTILHDHGGVNGRLRVWVHTGDSLVYRSEYMGEKAVEMEGESVKKASAQDVDRMRSGLLRNHQDLMTGMNLEGVASALAANGTATFAEKDGFLPDVRALLGDVEGEAEPEEQPSKPEDNSSQAGSSGSSPQSEEKKGKKDDGPKVWPDRDRIVSSTMRAVKSQIAAFKIKSGEQLRSSQKVLDEVERNAEEARREAEPSSNLAPMTCSSWLVLVPDGIVSGFLSM